MLTAAVDAHQQDLLPIFVFRIFRRSASSSISLNWAYHLCCQCCEYNASAPVDVCYSYSSTSQLKIQVAVLGFTYFIVGLRLSSWMRKYKTKVFKGPWLEPRIPFCQKSPDVWYSSIIRNWIIGHAIVGVGDWGSPACCFENYKFSLS